MDIPSTADRVAALITEQVQEYAERGRQIAALEAERVRILAEAARIVDATAQSLMPVGTSPARAQELARRSLQAELSLRMRVPEQTIARLIGEAEVLVGSLPETMIAFEAGEISAAHARAITEQTITLDPAARAEFECAVLPRARTQTVSQLRSTLRRLRERVHPESITVRHRRAVGERHLSVVPAADGMAWLSLYTTGVVATAAADRLLAVALQASQIDDGRTIAQLQVDAANCLLLGGAVVGPRVEAPLSALEGLGPVLDASDSISDPLPEETWMGVLPNPVVVSDQITPTVHITVPVLSLLGLDDAPASLDGYGPIDSETAERLAMHAPSFIRLLTHPETGAVLSVGRDRYTPPTDLKRALVIRDGTCRFPTCNRNVKRCDIDHTTAWAAGGETSTTNLAHLCPKHHHLKHDTPWTLTQDQNGALIWRTPSGSIHVSVPDPPDWEPLLAPRRPDTRRQHSPVGVG